MKKILLSDDDEESLLEIASALGGRYEVVTAANAGRALEMLDTSYALVLSDLNMPEHDGLWLAGKIRDKFQGKIPVIIMTGAAETLDSCSLKKVAVQNVLSKPFNMQYLFTVILNAIGK